MRAAAVTGVVGFALILLVACASGEDPDGGTARALFPELALAPLAGHAVEAGAPGNIVLLVIDALRPDHLGAYGYDRPTSPFLDSLAAESHVFLHHSVGAPWTQSSTATMLSGLDPQVHGCETPRCKLPPRIESVAQDLQGLGYRTGAVVANLNASSLLGFDRGFEEFIDPVREPVRFASAPTAANVFALASEWLDRAEPDPRPFFLFLFLVDPHAPYETPSHDEKWLAGHDGPRVRMPDIEGDYPEPVREAMVALYDAAIESTDDELRGFVESLKARGLFESTSLLITADHGEAFGEHGFYRHNFHLWNEFVHVPLVIRSPAWRGKGHVFHLTRAVDLRPTLIALAGGTPPPGLPGVDLGARLSEGVDVTRPGFSSFRGFGDRRGSIFDLRYRVILERPDKGGRKRGRSSKFVPASVSAERVQVFDRRRDPRELDDLAPDRIPAEADAMLRELRARMGEGPGVSPVAPVESLPADVIDQLRAMGYVDPEERDSAPQ